MSVINAQATSLYRRILRFRHKIKDPCLRRRFVYNSREFITLYSRPEICFTLPRAELMPALEGGVAAVKTVDSTSCSSASASTSLKPNKAESSKIHDGDGDAAAADDDELTPFQRNYMVNIWPKYQAVIQEKIRLAHEDLTLLERIFDVDEELLARIMPAFTSEGSSSSQSSKRLGKTKGRTSTESSPLPEPDQEDPDP